MNLQKAIENVINLLSGKQNPDHVAFDKQWDETGRLKGWMVNCEWERKDGDTDSVTFDITSGYIRIIGNLDNMPNYEPGKHQRV